MIEQRIARLLHGNPTLEPASIQLHAGLLNARWEQGTLCHIRLGDQEILQQVYAAVRDVNWGSVTGVLTDVQMNIQNDHFRIEFYSLHRQNEIDFRWHGTIEGSNNSVIIFRFLGQAYTTFQYNRIGFCVLHPLTCAGQDCHIEQVDGTIIEGRFPREIAPHQPFKAIRSIQSRIQPEGWLEIRMEGDTFEMEDQRNWTDASFKTYCTPLELPFPQTIPMGTTIKQTVRLSLIDVAAPLVSNSSNYTSLTLQKDHRYSLPALGLGGATHSEPLSEKNIQRLRQLQLSHIRLDVRPGKADWQTRLQSDLRQAALIGTGLEIAIHLYKQEAQELLTILKIIRQHDLPVLRCLLFHDGEKTTRAQWVEMARSLLGNSVPIVGGTDANFAELNRERPPYELLDGIVYSMNPQVHAFDDASLMQTLAAQTVTLLSARKFCGEKPLHVSPVTFKMRWNPNATAAPDNKILDTLLVQVDSRQMSLFGAGWTLGSIRALTRGGAASATYFETTSYLGVMATASGSARLDQFWTIRDGVYPLYHVLADYGEFARGQLLDVHTSDENSVQAVVLIKERKLRVMIANLTHQSQDIRLRALPGEYMGRILDQSTVKRAMEYPEDFRAEHPICLSCANDQDEMTLQLLPFASITLDQVEDD